MFHPLFFAYMPSSSNSPKSRPLRYWSATARTRFPFLLFTLLTAPLAFGQNTSKTVQPGSLEQHYQAARTFAVAGNMDQATTEYREFLSDVFRAMGNARTHEGKFDTAFPLFDEAILLDAQSLENRLGYGTALLLAGETDRAKAEADKAVDISPNSSEAQYLLGRVLLEKADYEGAKQHLEAAAKQRQGDVSFQLGYSLAFAYLKLKDVTRASALFDEMMLGYGDKAKLHLYFGYAYLMSGSNDRAISEFKKALQKDPKIKEAHYLLGLSYLSRDEDKGWEENAVEDRAEIQINPDDFAPHYDLGNIALHQHRTDEAERELKRAAEIQPDNPDPLIALGELLISQQRLPDAEAAMSKAIALTKDPSRNGYQVNRAYYVLGRIQVETGRRELGIENLKMAAQLRDKTVAPANRDNSAATASQRIADVKQMRPEDPASSIPPEQQKQLEQYFDSLRPAIADAYNNLGVAAGAKNDFTTAIADFHKAQHWYPQLQTLNRNLGMASFHAGDYQTAILPLWDSLQQNPDDERVRVALGLCYFSAQNYQGTLETLAPIQNLVEADAGAGTAYAVSLIKTGKYEQGIALLKSLVQANPSIAGIHQALGETYADQGIYAEAIAEFRKSLSLDDTDPRTRYLLGVALLRNGNPADAVPELRAALARDGSNAQTKYHLALALLQSGQKDEAAGLFRQVVELNPKYADAFYQLGKLQLESGDAGQAITNLESAAALSPSSDYIHYQLSLAYGREARADDAQREMQLYQTLKTERRGDHEQPRSN